MKTPIWFACFTLLFLPLLSAEFVPVQLKEGRQPAYPEERKASGENGEVRLRATIDEEGRVAELSVLSATHESFGEAAMETVRAWRFQPATRDGQPVTQTINIPIVFRMSFNDRINALAGYRVFVDIDELSDRVHGWSDVKKYFNVRGGVAARTMAYPESLRGSGITEEIVVECIISPEGRPLNPRLVDLNNRELAVPAVEHVVKLRFERPQLNGQPIYLRQRVKLICAE